MVSRAKYKRVPDLYTVGTEVVLEDGTVMWLQVPNPFQYDEARHDAAVARSRLVLALKAHGEDELVKVRGNFMEDGVEGAINLMIQAKNSDFLIKAYEGIRADPDWRERADIIDRGEEILARAPEDAERKLLLDIGEAYTAEMGKRIAEQADDLRSFLSRLSEDDLWQEFQDFYLERRGGELALAEYKLTELWYAARCCDGVQRDGVWDHSACDGHELQVFEDKAEVRALPAELQGFLSEALATISLTERQAKKEGSQGSSSASSPLLSVPAASTPSTPAATPDAPHGSSTSPSPTPSPSSVGSS